MTVVKFSWEYNWFLVGICWLFIENLFFVFKWELALYPLWISLSVSWDVIFVNVGFCEFVLKYLIVAIAFLHALGWYEVRCMYSCLLVFFVWVFMSSMFVVSKLGPL